MADTGARYSQLDRVKFVGDVFDSSRRLIPTLLGHQLSGRSRTAMVTVESNATINLMVDNLGNRMAQKEWMISFAQNGEDVLLARAFRGIRKGFYVDIGAWEPIKDSVTFHFYQMGWRGINIEPQPAYAELLRAQRRRDITLELAVGASCGRTKFFAMAGSGLSTMHADLAIEHEHLGFPTTEIEVDVVSLNDVFAEHCEKDVHFLKIDCEGSEADVLIAFDLARYRPWIILVEATHPLSEEPSYAGWEPKLLANGYTFVYFDGLNRFYLAKEREELLSAFSSPPNVFDRYLVAYGPHEIQMIRRAKRKALADLVKEAKSLPKR